LRGAGKVGGTLHSGAIVADPGTNDIVPHMAAPVPPSSHQASSTSSDDVAQTPAGPKTVERATDGEPPPRGTEAAPAGKPEPQRGQAALSKVPAIILALVVIGVAGLSIWYLVRPEPLLLQGEVDATRLDIAARVDGRVADIPVVRGQNVPAGAVLVRIDNPETLAKLQQARAARVVAQAQLANIAAGTRPEVIAARKAAYERAQSAATLAQQTYDRLVQLLDKGYATRQQVDQATDSLRESQKGAEQARFAYEQAVNGYTLEERLIAVANERKAVADIEGVQSIVDQMVVYAPVASQVYKRNVEPGEYVSPGVPLFTLIDLNDTWIHFDLREDLARTLKVGDRFEVRVPALRDRTITVEVKLLATRGEYASWRATRATGDFDLRTFEVRAYPVDRAPELRPGMSAYTDWRDRR
jgi:HlyD family secretion protein